MDTFSETALRDWLRGIEEAGVASEEAVSSLGRMVQGFKLRLPAEDEPFLLIYNAAVSFRCVPELTLAARALLECWRDGQWQPSLRERGQYNLLQLCTEIGVRAQLGGPIWELYRRRLVSGDYEAFKPIPLTRTLLKAMIRNPSDIGKAAELWKLFLNFESDGYLEGTPLDGFMGMLYLPEHGSRTERIRELAECLLILHGMKEENLLLNAVASLKRVEPSLARAVVEKAVLDISVEIPRRASETGHTAIELTLQELNEVGNQQLAEDFGQKWSRVCVRLEDELKASAVDRKLRTTPQIESYLWWLTCEEFNPKYKPPYGVFRRIVREQAPLREPASLRPYQCV